MSLPAKIQAQVKNGRLLVNVPTDLPEGTVLDLVAADPYADLDEADELEPVNKAKLDAALDESWAEVEAGKTYPIEKLWEELDQR